MLQKPKSLKEKQIAWLTSFSAVQVEILELVIFK